MHPFPSCSRYRNNHNQQQFLPEPNRHIRPYDNHLLAAAILSVSRAGTDASHCRNRHTSLSELAAHPVGISISPWVCRLRHHQIQNMIIDCLAMRRCKSSCGSQYVILPSRFCSVVPGAVPGRSSRSRIRAVLSDSCWVYLRVGPGAGVVQKSERWVEPRAGVGGLRESP